MRLAITLVVSSSLYGCSCGGAGGTRVDDFPAEAAKTVCTKVYACCTAAEAMPTNFGPDQPGCEAKVKMGTFDVDTVKRSVTAGRLVYHSDKAADCLAQYAALTCEQLKTNATATPAACDGLTEPKVAPGGACSTDRECIGGTCDGEGIGTDGVCVSFLTESSSCADGGVCGSGLYCGGGACRKTLADGTACAGNFECTTGGCNGRDAGVAGTCGLKGGAGTTCYATTGCSSAGGFVAAAFALLVLLAATRPRVTSGRA